MKRLLSVLILAASIGTASAEQLRSITPTTNFEVTNLSSMNELMQVWDSIKGKRYIKDKTHCYDRAHSWAYDIHKAFGYNTKKMIIHYSKGFMDELDWGWSWHVAPMIEVNGVEYVLDKQFLDKPVTKQEWLDHFAKMALEPYQNKYKIKISNAQWKIDRIRAGKGKFWWGSASSYREDIAEYRAKLRAIGIADENAELKTTCKPIVDIVEMDYDILNAMKRDITKISCYSQEASMYYKDLPELRLINYGTSSMKQIPFRAQLPAARAKGVRYFRSTWDLDEIWEAKARTFKDAEELFYYEYRNYERRHDR